MICRRFKLYKMRKSSFRNGIIFFAALSLFALACQKKTERNATPPPPPNTTPNLKLIADSLASPLTVVEPPDHSGRLFIVDQIGKVWIIGSNGSRNSTPFIDISSKMVTLDGSYDERGLLGMAFHPGYGSNGRFFLFYTAPPRAGGPQPGTGWNSLTRISEFHVSASSPDLADMNSEKIILEADHPQGNHNGGTIVFGPEGDLYISIGDGGGGDDVGPGHVPDWYAVNAGGNGQDIYQNLMGSILRIDVDLGSPYRVPLDNPFVGTSALPEIYAYGFRNPYRFSMDMGGTHQLLVGDAGQSLYEEIDLVTKGGNYGWNVREGAHCFNAASDHSELSSCPTSDSAGHPLIDPVIELKNYSNPGGGGLATVIIGGYMYRGQELPGMRGQYIFGIFSQDGSPNAKVYAATPASAGSWNYQDIRFKDYETNLGQYLKGFGQDQSGEVYLATNDAQGISANSGRVYKIVGLP